jgi:hypothetical protein
MQTIESVIEGIQKSAKTLQEVRVIQEMKIGQVVRQGDIYLERIKSIQGKGKEVKSRQLAPGTSKGSRHIVQEGEKIKIFQSAPELKNKFQFQVGPAIESEKEFSVTHPEHATIKMPAGCFQVYFQADILRQQRVKD